MITIITNYDYSATLHIAIFVLNNLLFLMAYLNYIIIVLVTKEF